VIATEEKKKEGGGGASGLLSANDPGHWKKGKKKNL